MTTFNQVSTNDLWNDGSSITITSHLVGTTLVLTWVPPAVPTAYAGAVVVVGTKPQGVAEQPVDGTRYVASSNADAPSSVIGSAQVVAAYYGYFNDTLINTVTVTNVDPNTIYYASIYACSNVLQYYSLGCQSYPLQSGPKDKLITPFAGSIPTASTPPLNPVGGQAYFDPSTNTVLIYNAQQLAWIKANQTTVPIGDELPIEQYQLFYNATTNTLSFFDGVAWQAATPANVRVKMGSTWSPFVSIAYQTSFPVGAPTGTFVYIKQSAAMSAPAISKLWLTTLGQWFLPTPDMVQVSPDGGTTWHNIVPPGVRNFYGNALPTIPLAGYFFYLTTTQRLMAWAGTLWAAIDTEERGTPTTAKTNIGTTNTNEARLELMTTLKNLLGYPAVCIELKESQFNVAINNALNMFRRYAENAYSHRHIAFTVYGDGTGGQSTYYLNDPRDGTDKIVTVLKIHRINQLGISQVSGEDGLYAQTFFNQLYQGSDVDVLSIHLMSQLSKTYEKIFAGNLMFTWDETSRQLTILRRFLQAEERVILEVAMERTDAELIHDRWSSLWLQEWAQAELMGMLGQIRTKYGTLPGAQGGLTLNGDALLAGATEKKTELMRQIQDYEVGNLGNFGNVSLLEG